jgi:ABC-type oligopeptide transport system substrate-binding subunit
MVEDPAISVQRNPNQYIQFLVMNSEKPPLDNYLVRKAIAYAIDYNSLLKAGFDGTRPSKPLLPMFQMT